MKAHRRTKPQLTARRCWLVLLLVATRSWSDTDVDGNGSSAERVCQNLDDPGSCLVSSSPRPSLLAKNNGATTDPSKEPLPPLRPEDVANKYGAVQSLQGYDVSYLLEVEEYFRTVVSVESKYDPVRNLCLNEDPLCTYWATIGECDKNPLYMRTSCAPACQSCHLLLFEERCPFDPANSKDAWQTGDLNRYFKRLTTDPSYQQYAPRVICKPGMVSERNGGDCPWIVALDDFLSEDECETLVELGAQRGYRRSEDVGARKPDGTYAGTVSEGRTSTNAWCQDECYANATVQQVLRRIESVTGIPDSHSEYLQLLRYEVGQFYESHHDYIEHNVQRAQGPRILTVFLYLNDVEAGGSTTFTDLGISVTPKRGRALVWPSVLNEDPTAIEPRTHHRADAVESGVKYGANAWIHLRDFKTPFKDNCI